MSAAESYADVIADTMDFIERHCASQLTLEFLSERAGISPFHFHRLFRAVSRQSIGSFKRRVRLQKAARHLRDPGQNILMIALECGYGSHEALSRAFKKWCGHSPSEYRTAYQSGRQIALSETQPFPRTAEVVSETRAVDWEMRWFAFRTLVGPYEELGHKFVDIEISAARFAAVDAAEILTAGIAYDDPDLVPPQQLRFEAGILLTEPSECPDDFQLRRLPQAHCLSTTIIGDYVNLVNGYDALYAASASATKTRFVDRPAFLVYRKRPPHVPLHDAATDIYLPIE